MEHLQTSFTLNSTKFFENYINVTHKLFGVDLQPFCLLHLLWLENIDSPFFHTSKKFRLSDLEVAVLICSSRSSEEILEKLNVKGWIRTIRKRFWHSKNKRRDLAKEVRAFLAYTDDYTCLPDYEETNSIESEEVLPRFLIDAAFIIKQTGWAQEYVFTMPLGQVSWFNSAFGYLETGKTSVTSDKKAAIRFAMRHQRQLTSKAG